MRGTGGFEFQGGKPGGCGIPETASAVAVNLVAVNPTGPGNLRAWPFGLPVPLASAINYASIPALNLANGIIVPLCEGAFCPFDFRIQADISATHLVADVFGYFDTSASVGDITGVIAGTGLTGGGSAGDATLEMSPSFRLPQGCSPDQVPRWIGVSWACTTIGGGGTVTEVGTGAGLTGGPIHTSGTVSIATGGVTSDMIANGTIGSADVSSSQIQVRVTGSCPADQGIRTVNADGSVICDPDNDSGGTVTQVSTGMGLSGGPITAFGTISVATGGISSAMIQDAGIEAVDINSSQVQRRVAGTCTAGQSIRAVATDGTVTCQSSGTGTVQQVNSGPGLVGGPITAAGTLSVDFGAVATASHNHLGQSWSGGVTTGLHVFGQTTGLWGISTVAGSPSRGVVGESGAQDGYGVYGISSGASGAIGVYGNATSTASLLTYGIRGRSASPQGIGVHGVADALSGPTVGVWAENGSPTGVAVRAQAYSSSGTNYGVFATTSSANGYGGYFSLPSNSGTGYAGYFQGRVHVNGALFVTGSKSFKIDHPLDPSRRYLTHAAVESSEMANLYSGIVRLDAEGTAIVQLPEWFEALNADFRYQLTCVGGYAPVYVAEEIRQGRFSIAGGKPGLKVSWQVIGTRKDAYALAHPIQVEEIKQGREVGTYLHPVEHGQPADMGLDYRQHHAHAVDTRSTGQ
jgi:hypothetical protein